MQKTGQFQDKAKGILPATGVKSTQLKKYGLFFIPDNSALVQPSQPGEDFENNESESAATERWTEQHSELQLLEHSI